MRHRYSTMDADHAGVQQQRLQPQLAAVAGDGVHAPRPCEHREHDHIRRAVENADAAQHSRHQGVADKAAVGKHRSKAQVALPLGIPIPYQQHSHHDEHHVQQQRNACHQSEIPQRLPLQRPLERHDHHAGRHHVHHKVAHGRGSAVVQYLHLAQHKAHHQQQVQRNDLLAYGKKRLKHGYFLSFTQNNTAQCITKPGGVKKNHRWTVPCPFTCRPLPVPPTSP